MTTPMKNIIVTLLGETSKFTIESHKLLQGDVGELFLRFLQFLQHVTKSHYYHKERGVDGGSRCRMSQCRRRPVEFKKQPCRPVKFKKQPCHMSLRPKKGRVALSILGVHTPKEGGNIVYNMHVNLPRCSTYINSDPSSSPQNNRTHLSKHIWLLLSLSICLSLFLAVLIHHPAVKFTVTYTWHCLVSTTRTMWCPLADKSNITCPLVFTERTIL